MLASCEPKLQVGELACPPSEGGGPGVDASGVFKACMFPLVAAGGASIAGAAGASGADAGGETSGGFGGADDTGEVCSAAARDGTFVGPFAAPWQTSFDAGFCNFEDVGGFCYADADSGRRTVTSPVHSGTFAAAFDMKPSSSTRERQTRCVREGMLPTEAYYGAWYYVPTELVGANDWNLFHFQSGVPNMPNMPLRGSFDVSMDDRAGDGLEVYIYDAINDGRYRQADPIALPRDRWVHLEFYWKRATDATGEVALYQDGQELVRRSGIVTDESPFGQWYVGNWTASLDELPSTVSLFVDDVTIRLP